MAEQTQIDRADTPTENISATATGEMPSPKLAKEREIATKKRSRLGLIVLGIVAVFAIAGFFVWRYIDRYEGTGDSAGYGHINKRNARVSRDVLKVYAHDTQYGYTSTVLVK